MEWATKATSGSESVTINTTGDNQFSLSCSGPGGSGSDSVNVEGYETATGFVVDGYISGAEVFIDQDSILYPTIQMNLLNLIVQGIL